MEKYLGSKCVSLQFHFPYNGRKSIEGEDTKKIVANFADAMMR